ncbi:sugar transferase [Vreelandella populi]|uniref:Sugar transferase n=1 Tax=Vreelandella populi TaxID=2498858 RepID=A0A3S0YNT8_9GAMM|nr:sugar transferase [Halomonas populi]RUR35567.1 sugar transferase [Halomonas populi]RUR47757.1 sugar transferase [Halomonas populi]RUR54380.1 sugar transferase [Halomonas populi]
MRDGIKRLFDIVVSSACLVVLSPLLLLVALWIKLDSKGPVFFMQRRAGTGGKPFRIFKFRTMLDRPADAINQIQESVIEGRRDPRITRAGRFIRATSLDELPQLLNIAKGDMSIVGPRPVLMEQKEVVPPSYMKRFSVRPGLTGLAQVSGRRSLGWLQQLWLDAEYVERYSFLYDIGIILRTVKVVLVGGGIYGGEGMNWRTYRESLNGCDPADEDVLQAMAKSSTGNQSESTL